MNPINPSPRLPIQYPLLIKRLHCNHFNPRVITLSMSFMIFASQLVNPCDDARRLTLSTSVICLFFCFCFGLAKQPANRMGRAVREYALWICSHFSVCFCPSQTQTQSTQINLQRCIYKNNQLKLKYVAAHCVKYTGIAICIVAHIGWTFNTPFYWSIIQKWIAADHKAKLFGGQAPLAPNP